MTWTSNSVEVLRKIFLRIGEPVRAEPNLGEDLLDALMQPSRCDTKRRRAAALNEAGMAQKVAGRH
jgi:hypothetical protein